jgi:DNA-binding transcriptional regulator YiaG
MNTEILDQGSPGSEENCINCGSSQVRLERQRQTFPYGTGDTVVDLTAEMPVYTCLSCGHQFAGPEAEDARHEAVCRHLGVLTPREIVAIREHGGLKRAQFVELTRIGVASLKRWEAGILVQNAANDQLIFLTAFPDNVTRLRERRQHDPINLQALADAVPKTASRSSYRRFRGRCIRGTEPVVQCATQWQLRVRG